MYVNHQLASHSSEIVYYPTATNHLMRGETLRKRKELQVVDEENEENATEETTKDE